MDRNLAAQVARSQIIEVSGRFARHVSPKSAPLSAAVPADAGGYQTHIP